MEQVVLVGLLVVIVCFAFFLATVVKSRRSPDVVARGLLRRVSKKTRLRYSDAPPERLPFTIRREASPTAGMLSGTYIDHRLYCFFKHQRAPFVPTRFVCVAFSPSVLPYQLSLDHNPRSEESGVPSWFRSSAVLRTAREHQRAFQNWPLVQVRRRECRIECDLDIEAPSAERECLSLIDMADGLMEELRLAPISTAQRREHRR